jgi:hypothetical protein
MSNSELRMNRSMKSLALTAASALMIAAPELSRAQSALTDAVQASEKIAPQVQSQKDLLRDLAGLNLTDEQQATINRIRQETAAHKDAVLKDNKLNADQKDAMLQGYDRLELGSIFRALSPEQQKQVREKFRARRQAEQNVQKKVPSGRAP